MFFGRFVLVWLIGFSCLLSFAFGATTLPDDEVKVLRQIVKTLGSTPRDFNLNPCTGGWNATSPNPDDKSPNGVTCNCSLANITGCHVVSIDLTRNYLNGTIPGAWGSMQYLKSISLTGNRLSGSIPEELGNISTLEELVLESNQLSGVLPPHLGNLSNIKKLILSSNNFTGELPEELAKLTNLTDFRISDNHFTGKIPNFIQYWTNLDRMRISDINGTETGFSAINLKCLNLIVLQDIAELQHYWRDTSLSSGIWKN
ncbi:hypothetical protein HHK36_005196 [Tetracentron sinense]|uniref:Uncharacterized protein n=1 Tax=Tetracentron sinense TaxID=13715 RepID=A0A835DM57_TETSI|nr:hypothetical protein HHK36_005196 [Tetracentron sinense]